MSLVQELHAEHMARQRRLGYPQYRRPRELLSPKGPVDVFQRSQPERLAMATEAAIKVFNNFPPLRSIRDAVAAAYGTTGVVLSGDLREELVSEARHVAIALTWELRRPDLNQLAKAYRRDRTTVLYGRNKFLKRIRPLVRKHLLDAAGADQTAAVREALEKSLSIINRGDPPRDACVYITKALMCL